MRTIIAGSRNITDYALVELAVWNARKIGINPTTVLSGMANGVDKLGIQWARLHGNMPVACFPADWKRYGSYAGLRRNMAMLEVADALVCIWDGKSLGTRHMFNIARDRIPVYVWCQTLDVPNPRTAYKLTGLF